MSKSAVVSCQFVVWQLRSCAKENRVLIYKRVRQNWRKRVADSIAFLLYTTYTGWVIVGYEWYFCDLAVGRVVLFRVMSGAPRIILGFFCGMIEDAVKEYLFGGTSGFWRQAAAGAIALCMFQFPFYLATALIMRAGLRQIVITCALYIASDISFGWSYVKVLQGMRTCIRADRDP